MIHREELTATLFAIADINDKVGKILGVLEEDSDGEGPEEDS